MDDFRDHKSIARQSWMLYEALWLLQIMNKTIEASKIQRETADCRSGYSARLLKIKWRHVLTFIVYEFPLRVSRMINKMIEQRPLQDFL